MAFPVVCSASLAASRLFLIPFNPSVPTQTPVLGCHLSATPLPIIPAVDPILQGTPSISKWPTGLHLPRLLISQTPRLPLGSGKDGVRLEVRLGLLVRAAELSYFFPEADAVETSKSDVILS